MRLSAGRPWTWDRLPGTPMNQLSGFPPETVVSASFDAGCARGVVSAVEAGKGDGGLDDECDSVVLVVD